MKYFLELIETIRSSGVNNWDIVTEARYKYSIAQLNQLFEKIEICQPFVFLPKNKEPIELDSPAVNSFEDKPLVNAPFSVFSIEIFGQGVTVYRSTDELKINIYCILCVEHSPNQWIYFLLAKGSAGQLVFSTNDTGSIVEEMLKRLKSEKVGVESVRERVKIGVSGEKRTHTFRKVIHIVPRKSFESFEGQKKNVNWAYRWPSRGHWRELTGRVGKDRQGNYSVQDWTWVTDSVKGPKDAPLITKTRVVS